MFHVISENHVSHAACDISGIQTCVENMPTEYKDIKAACSWV